MFDGEIPENALIITISAMAALGTAAFGIVEASKAFWGGIANVGFGHILRACAPLSATLRKGMGDDSWVELLQAQWRNGRAKDEQKAILRSLVRLGLTAGAAEELAALANVSEEGVRELAGILQKGDELSDLHQRLLGRIDAAIGMRIDVAFEKAEQQYRNIARLAAAAVAVALSLTAVIAINKVAKPDVPLAYALIVGILAVPIAPLANDLVGGLSAAMRALKANRPS